MALLTDTQNQDAGGGEPEESERLPALFARTLRAIISPTWGFADVMKPHDEARRAVVIVWFNQTYFVVALTSMLLALWSTGNSVGALTSLPYAARILWAFFLWSRCWEVLIAFHKDAMDKLAGRKSQSTLSGHRRVVLALSSYVELIIDFALLHSLVTGGMWGSNVPMLLTDMLWMSASTITTSGGGGFVPTHWLAQALSILEVFDGVILLVVCFTLYANLSAKDTATGASRRRGRRPRRGREHGA